MRTQALCGQAAHPDEARRNWVKVKNPKAPAVKREAEEDWELDAM